MALTPSSVQAATTYNFVSSLDLVQNIHKPTIDNQLTKRYGNQNITGFMHMQGAMNPVSSTQYTHFEEDWIHSIVQVAAQGGGSAGATVTLTVGSSYQYVYPTTAQAPYITYSNTTTNPVRLNDIILFPNGVRGIVTTRGATTFAVTPTGLTDSIPATLTTDQLIISGNTWGEQTDQPTSRNSRVIRYTNNLMISKDSHTTSGTEMGVQLWFTVQDQNGKTGYLWYFKGQLDTYNRFENEFEIQLLTGKKITNTSTDIDATATITEGLIPFIENYGNNDTYSAVSGVQLADFENYIVTIDRNRGSKENTLWTGIILNQGVDAFMRDTMKNGAIQYGAFGGDKQKAIDFGFDSFTLSNYTFHKKVYDLFNHPQLLGAAGQPYQTMGLIIPADNVAATFEPGAKGKVMVPSLRINYLMGNGNNYSRNSEEWVNAGANGVYTTSIDQWQYNLRGQRGFEGFAANRFMKITQA